MDSFLPFEKKEVNIFFPNNCITIIILLFVLPIPVANLTHWDLAKQKGQHFSDNILKGRRLSNFKQS